MEFYMALEGVRVSRQVLYPTSEEGHSLVCS